MEGAMSKDRKIHILLSPWFLISLFILLLNDYVLKAGFPSWITGKLSDFSGIFVLILFLVGTTSVSPKLIGWITAIGFTLWKSSYSSPVIDLWNTYFPNISRVVDYTDLLALSVIPMAISYAKSSTPVSIKKILLLPVILVSAFAIMGTSRAMYNTPIEVIKPAIEIKQNDISLLKKLDDFAEEKGWQNKHDPSKTSRRYVTKSASVSVYANYDNDTQKLYLRVSGLQEETDVINKIRGEVLSQLESEGNIEIMEAPVIDTWTEDPYFKWHVRMHGYSAGGPVTKLSDFVMETGENVALNNLYQVIATSLEDRGYNYRVCRSGVDQYTCREYLIGSVLGPYEYSKSTRVLLSLSGRWLKSTLNLSVVQYVQEDSIPAEKLAAELNQELMDILPEEIEFETLD